MEIQEFNFEKLIAWQIAKALCIEIYAFTKKLPKEEKYNFTSQIYRSVQSISSNIAEGSSKSHSREKKRYINIAYGSLIELSSQLIISNEIYNYLSDMEMLQYRKQAIELTKILSGLLKSIK